MNDSLDYDKLCKDMNHIERSEIQKIYEGLSLHCNNIIQSSASRITNWSFALNTGGLTASLAYQSDNTCSFILFSFGLLFIVCANLLENFRFTKRGKTVDQSYNELQQDKITGEEFFDKTINRPKFTLVDELILTME